MSNYFIVVSCGKEGLPRLPMRTAPGKNFFLHKNLPSAYAEATRLANQHHGIKFGVFEWLGAVVHEDAKVVDVSVKIEVP
jgi:hypothetical protein